MLKTKFSKIRFAGFAGALLLSALCFVPSIYAQSGGVKGKVKNMNGDGIGGATITARINNKDVRTVTSTKKGDFQIDGLEAGIYNLVFDANGYAAGVKYNVEVKSGKTRDLGGNLILLVDRGSQVIVNGSVFYKDGTSIAGAKVEIERIEGGSKKMTMFTGESGEIAFRQPEGRAKFRITATYKDVSATKELEVDTAAIYSFSIILDLERPKR